MLQAAKVATIVAAGIILLYLQVLWFPKTECKNWREVVRAKDWGVAICVALGAWVLVFFILSSFFLALK